MNLITDNLINTEDYSLDRARLLLKQFFGYESFRSGQEELIQTILEGRDCLGIMPTGAGKSLCYQIPSLMLPGITIVISPLISLMKDQVDSLNQVGISSTFINSSLTDIEYAQTMQNASLGMYKIIYVAPERLVSDSFLYLLNNLDISLFAIDEAHCVSRWGHDFRPSYQEIANVILNFKKRPIVAAFTATATELVKEDVIQLLHLESPYVITTGFESKNFFFFVEQHEKKKDFIFDFLEKNQNDSGIIYCLTRKLVDELFEDLTERGFSVAKYHGGMTDKQRIKNQEDFVYDRNLIMVATNAFGMGIDKSNIRYVIHYNMPRDIESYYQEAGRAGRDGDNSNCVLLFSRADIVTNKFLIEQGSSDSNHSAEYDKLNDMVDYCNTDKCLRKYMLEYFGEIPLFDNCNNCGNCESEIELTDITTDAKKILSCIKRMHERFGSGLVTDVLKGSKSAKIKSFGFDKLSTYGIMHEYSKNTIKDIISFLVAESYIKCVGEQYPILVLTPNANNILFNDEKVFIKRKIEKMDLKTKNISSKNASSINTSSQKNSSRNNSVSSDLPFDAQLFAILRDIRIQVARNENIPPFLIFADVSLKEMSTYYPINVENFLKISGVGAHKLEHYGDIFIKAIKDYVEENNIVIPVIDEPSKEHKVESDFNTENVTLEKIDSKKIKNETREKEAKEIKLKEDTKIVSYNLYNEGKTIKEIADIRSLTVQTIENHLLKCFEEGLQIDIEKYVQFDYKDEIIEAIQNLGSERLKPLKEVLPEEVTYFDIRYFIAWVKKYK